MSWYINGVNILLKSVTGQLTSNCPRIYNAFRSQYKNISLTPADESAIIFIQKKKKNADTSNWGINDATKKSTI